MPDKKLVLKTEIKGDELFAVLHAMALTKYKKKKHVAPLFKEGAFNTITRVEVRTEEEPDKLSDLTFIVEIFVTEDGGLHS